MQTDSTLNIGKRVQRRLAADGLSEIATGLLLFGANVLPAMHQTGHRAFERPLLVMVAVIALAAALIVVPQLRRRFVDPRVGFARGPRPGLVTWLVVALAVVAFMSAMEVDENGLAPYAADVAAILFPVALAYMAHTLAAPRLYAVAIAAGVAVAISIQAATPAAGLIATTAAITGIAMAFTGAYAFARFLITHPDLEAVPQ